MRELMKNWLVLNGETDIVLLKHYDRCCLFFMMPAGADVPGAVMVSKQGSFHQGKEH